MSNILTKGNCKFECQYLTGEIIIMSGEQSISDINSFVLTQNSELQCVGVCSIKTAQAEGVLQPCSSNLSNWIAGVERSIKFNGSAALNEKAKKRCNDPAVSGVIISANYNGKRHITVGKKYIVEPINLSNNNFEDKQLDTKENKELKDDKKDSKVDEDYQNVEVKERELTDEDIKYADCNYKNCPKALECEYLKASHQVIKSGIQDSIILRRNSKEKEKTFLEEDSKLQNESRLYWANNAHHIISINAVFNQYPKLVKLAYFYGYDINNFINCIFLPSNAEKGFSLKDDSYKKARAYEVMGITGMQWHTGQHQYKVSMDEFLKIPPEVRVKLRCYNDEVNMYIKEKVIPRYFNSRITCRYDSINSMENKVKAKRFIETMNSVSKMIEKKLKAFVKPTESFPYFVSLESMRYTYNLPRSGKIIIIENNDDVITFSKYKYTKYLKNDNKVLINQYEEELNVQANDQCNLDWNNIINYCENIAYFFIIENNHEIKFPFKYRLQVFNVIKKKSELYIKLGTTDLYNIPFNKKLERENALEILGYFIGVYLMNDENSYRAPQMVILRRKRECGIIDI